MSEDFTENSQMIEFEIEAGTVVKLNGLPVKLKSPVSVETSAGNYRLLTSHSATFGFKLNHAVSLVTSATSNKSF